MVERAPLVGIARRIDDGVLQDLARDRVARRNEVADRARLAELAKGLKTTIFVRNAGEFAGDLVYPAVPSCEADPDCDDGLYCNGVEDCVSGSCVAGTPVSCDDGVACTDDACNEGTDSCDNTPNDAACDNGLFCDGAETCHASLDCQGGTAPDCE